MKKRADGAEPTPKPRTQALVRRSVGARAIGAGAVAVGLAVGACEGGGDTTGQQQQDCTKVPCPQPPQISPQPPQIGPQPPPQDAPQPYDPPDAGEPDAKDASEEG